MKLVSPIITLFLVLLGGYVVTHTDGGLQIASGLFTMMFGGFLMYLLSDLK